jgi:hypothetical protein
VIPLTLIDMSISRFIEGVTNDLHSWSNPICTRCHCKELIIPMDAESIGSVD